jgi:hypothetical protein
VRPLCRCHGEPMLSNGPVWRCAVKRRAYENAARRARYRANVASENYARTRREIRARIERKRQQVKELEASLAEENARGG